MDASALRTEIKSWERSFAAEHGRKPTVAEIKADPISKKYHIYKKLRKAESEAPSTPRKAKVSTTPSKASSTHKPVSVALRTPKRSSRPPTGSFTPEGMPAIRSTRSRAAAETVVVHQTPQKQVVDLEEAETPMVSPQVALGPTPSVNGRVVSLLEGLDSTPMKDVPMATPVKTVLTNDMSEVSDEFTTPSYLRRIAVEMSPPNQKRLSFAERLVQSVIEAESIVEFPKPATASSAPLEQSYDDDEDALREMEGLPPRQAKSVEVGGSVGPNFNGEYDDLLEEIDKEDWELDEDIMESMAETDKISGMAAEKLEKFDEPVEGDLDWVHEPLMEGDAELSAPIYREETTKRRKHQTQKRTTRKAIVRVESDKHRLPTKVNNDNFTTTKKLNTGFKVNVAQKEWARRFKK